VKKIKELWLRIINASVLWFVIPVSIIVIIPTLWYTRPLLNLNTDDITVTVGIGTVVNSTRSAKTAAESIKLTKEKETREQSSHLIVMSLVEKIHFNLPYSTVPSDLSLFDYKIKYDTQDSDLINRFVDVVKKYKEYNYNHKENIHKFKLFNSGKGSAVNLEYTFNFKNLSKFHGYYLSLPLPVVHLGMEPYSLKIKKTSTSKTIIDFQNLYIKEEMLGLEAHINKIRSLSMTEFYADENSFKMYFDIVKPQDDIELFIPNEFIILCKHFLNVKKLQKDLNIVIKNFHGESYLELEKFRNHSPIMPIGEINLTYYDESLIRSGEYDSQKVNELKYTVKIKEIYTDSNKVDMYLEVNLANPEKQPKMNRKVPWLS